MSEQKTKQAFPTTEQSGFVHHGMSLREYYAGEALAGLLASGEANGSAELIARCCVNCSDALMKELGYE